MPEIEIQSSPPSASPAPLNPSLWSAFRLLGFSFLLLFFEVALIRFVPATVQAASYFINLVLIAAFLGMGVGMILQSRGRNTVTWFAPFLLLVVASVHYFSNVVVEYSSVDDEFLYGMHFYASPEVGRWGVELVVFILFVLSTFVFVPLGSGIAREFDKFKPLVAYSLNILGSLAGLAVFSLFSWFSSVPIIWFAFGILIFLSLCIDDKKTLLASLLFPVVLYLVYDLQGGDGKFKEVWSPYYKINYQVGNDNVRLDVNGSLHQYMLNMKREYVEQSQSKVLNHVRNGYLAPYAFVNSLENVLVLGAGSGNDVALALEQGARHVDAVEIDPSILELGKRYHFMKPYADDRVTIHNDDARAFLKKSDARYDLVILGTLDSQTLLSSMSSIRLDNYVYTAESFESIRKHLKPDGILVVYHLSAKPYIALKIFSLLTEAFGKPPLVKSHKAHLFNMTFVGGWDGEMDDAFQAHPVRKDFNKTFSIPRLADGSYEYPVALATDGWPYLYLPQPSIPGHYLKTGGLILLFAIFFVVLSAGKKTGATSHNWPMFFLGAGFMLLETKSVTEMSLLFGSTWVVNVLVFSAILVMVLFANLMVIRSAATHPKRHYGFLVVTLILSYFIPVNQFLGLPLGLQWALGSLLVALPIFFSGILFALIFRQHLDPARALGYNVLGAVLGGLLEYSSMFLGTKPLYMISLLMYVAAFYFWKKSSSKMIVDYAVNPGR